jgi:predicted outer membrane protein
MLQSISSKLAVGFGLGALLTAAVTLAEPQAAREREDARTRQSDSLRQRREANKVVIPDTTHADAQLAAWLVVDNEGEVALGQFAQQRSQDAQVKEFAQQMVDAHQQIIQKLRQVAGEGRRAAIDKGNERRDQAVARREARDRRQDDAGAEPRNPNVDVQVNAPGSGEPRISVQSEIPGGGRRVHAGGLDFVAIKREIGEQCQQTLKAELEKKEGPEFDKCYLGQQIMAHMQMIDTLKVFQQHASEELKPVLAEGQQTAQGHLEHAKELIKKIEGAATDSARRDESGQRNE